MIDILAIPIESPIPIELKIFRTESFFLRQDQQRASHTMEADKVDSLWVQLGRVVRALDLQFGAPEFKSRRDR